MVMLVRDRFSNGDELTRRLASWITEEGLAFLQVTEYGDSKEGSSPTSSSWEPKTGSGLAALKRARTQEPKSRLMPMFPLDSEEGSSIGARV
ncbi:hypothetical protein FH972_012810 [Carpinus fangiana]|uniref:Uncharacterized protein n=1 Tax=Carpinus fangiana TaxID=176857 RepID=A0A5N6R8A5_9ROSI|nr:hypothetical protein FH972_012810 [Carpinus fangiana]